MARAPTEYFIRLPVRWMQLPAWTELSPYARSILLEMMARYRPDNNALELSERVAAQIGNCSRERAAMSLVELEKRGWVEVLRIGKSVGTKERRCTEYALTMYARNGEVTPARTFEHYGISAKSQPAMAGIQAGNSLNLGQMAPFARRAKPFASR